MSIVVEKLTHIYNKGLAYETSAVTDVSFAVGDGEFVAIIGHTGSGKSTLIQHLNGLLKPTEGKVTVDDVDITVKGIKAVETRRKIGMVFQYPEYQLFEETVYKDIAFGPKNLGLSEEEIGIRVREAMQLVDVDFDEFAERTPFELSGGQKRKIAIAGVIAMRPKVLILDEPTAGLDPQSHLDILSMIMDIQKKSECSIVLVSHNMDDVARLADRVLVLAEGKLVIDDIPSKVFADEKYMRSIGLDIPQARDFALNLRGKGVDLSQDILTINGLIDAIVARKNSNEQKGVRIDD